MQKFEKFYFENFEFDENTLKAKFYYSFDEKIDFVEEIDFSTKLLIPRKNIDKNIINNFLFPLSIALWISYYKLYPTWQLIIKTWFLSEEDKYFWVKFYKNWLWEFLYKNNISFEWLFNFINFSDKFYPIIDFKTSDDIFLPIWWWKDSIVSAELLSENWYSFTPFIFWKTDAIKDNCLKVMWKEALVIKRKMDENLFKLNQLGYYNWHVPITWIISFVLLTTAYIYDFRYLVMSNEKSANSGNTSIWNLEVNHQYSKSLEFEKDLKDYIERNLSTKIKYFSLLRWMYEINIAKIFSNIWKKYFSVFSSCNANFKISTLPTNHYELGTHLWCNSCPKCAFVYAILKPYITDIEVMQIFWKDLYSYKSLENLFLELLWIKWHKPFECVWEKEEVLYAMHKTLKNYNKENKAIPYILGIFEKEIHSKYDEKFFKEEKSKLFKIDNEKTLIPKYFNKIFK